MTHNTPTQVEDNFSNQNFFDFFATLDHCKCNICIHQSLSQDFNACTCLHWKKNVTYMYFGRMTLIANFVVSEHVWA